MNYPFWDAGVGYGVLMATIAVVHVFISHFAIGGGLYLVVTETRARRRGATVWLEHLERLSRFFVLTTLVLGALTGVGIWFVIGLLNPAATELLIHNFVWGWAIEWTFFVIEIAAAIVYYYGWRRMSPATHLRVGWLYFAAAWLSLAVINGILSFMLTPGDWLATGSFWDGVLNPTYLPSLVLRTGICVLLAGLYSLAVASRMPASPEKTAIVHYDTVWALVGLAIAAPAGLWTFRALPAALVATARASMPWPMEWLAALGWLALALAAGLVLFGLIFGRHLRLPAAVLLMALAFAGFGSFEFLRESIRKPWIVAGTMYGNGIEVERIAELQSGGLLPALAYRTGDDGRDLFQHACGSCHTVDGYKSMRRVYDGTDAAYIAATIRGAHRMRGNMPPFAGTAAEVDTLAGWIAARIDRRPLAEITGLSGIELGRRSYDLRCGKCHEIGGRNDKTASLDGYTRADLEDFLGMAGDLSDEMPPFHGDDAEREALAEYLLSVTGGAR